MHFFIFCDMLYLCNVLPAMGQYSIDITIKYSFKCYYAIAAFVAYNWAHVF